MRGITTPFFVSDGDLFFPKSVGGKFDFAIFTCPNFGKIEGGIFKFFITRAEGLSIPANGNLLFFTSDFDQLQGDIIRRNWQRGIIGINGRDAERVTFNIHQGGFHPAGIITANGLDLYPACIIQASDDLKIAAFDQTIFIKIRRTRTIPAIGTFEHFTA